MRRKTMSRYYLLLYNLVSLLAWTYLTARVLFHSVATTTPGDEAALLLLLRTDIALVTAVQSAAALEVLHAAAGLVRASPAAAAVQIGGRNLVVWTVMRRFPDLVVAPGLGRTALRGCLAAWGCSDVLRYALFVAVALGRGPPKALKWLRYTAFILLYPVGFLSEASLGYLSLVRAGGIGLFYRGYLFAGLLSYIPASYFLYTYMFSQRRRALGLTERVENK
ncbi:PTPLA-domain-containing protein [Ustulina deusta]|nr:PTPLA-domain-containing protein [Ustulina deusta]